MKYLLLLLLVTVSYAGEEPIAKLGSWTSVYALFDEVSQKRFLVVIGPDGGMAMIEAPPARFKPEPPMTPEPAKPAVRVDTSKQYWEEAQSYSFKPEHAAKGWELVRISEAAGGRLYHLRRKNPHYKGPPLEDAPLEK